MTSFSPLWACLTDPQFPFGPLSTLPTGPQQVHAAHLTSLSGLQDSAAGETDTSPPPNSFPTVQLLRTNGVFLACSALLLVQDTLETNFLEKQSLDTCSEPTLWNRTEPRVREQE